MPDKTEARELQIFPRRLMDSKKADDFVALLKEMPEVEEVFIHGPSYKGGGHIVGSVIIRVHPGVSISETTERIKPICEQYMQFGFDLRAGQFTKTRPTVKDYVTGKLRG